jgi:diketogulonate reductase-like aldo/keto reductase
VAADPSHTLIDHRQSKRQMNKLSISSYALLHNGVKMPLLGLGTYKIREASSIDSVIKAAYEIGIKLIDTGSFYKNEKEIGDVIRKNGIPREDMFITSKLWFTDHGYQNTLDACNRSLKDLGMDYLDLFLVNWPGTEHDGPKNPQIRRETWRAMEQLYREKKCRAIGVSNYTIRHLKEMLESDNKVNIVPMVNQFELHPKLTQKPLIDYCRKHGIVVESYSPFGKGKLLTDPKLQQMAKKYKVSVAQLIVRWILQQGIVCIPKSDKIPHIQTNADVFYFEISDEDMHAIDEMNENWHCTWNPEDVE